MVTITEKETQEEVKVTTTINIYQEDIEIWLNECTDEEYQQVIDEANAKRGLPRMSLMTNDFRNKELESKFSGVMKKLNNGQLRYSQIIVMLDSLLE